MAAYLFNTNNSTRVYGVPFEKISKVNDVVNIEPHGNIIYHRPVVVRDGQVFPSKWINVFVTNSQREVSRKIDVSARTIGRYLRQHEKNEDQLFINEDTDVAVLYRQSSTDSKANLDIDALFKSLTSWKSPHEMLTSVNRPGSNYRPSINVKRSPQHKILADLIDYFLEINGSSKRCHRF